MWIIADIAAEIGGNTPVSGMTLILALLLAVAAVGWFLSFRRNRRLMSGHGGYKFDQMLMNSALLSASVDAANIAYFCIDRNMNLLYASSTKYWPVVDGVAMPIEKWVAPEDAAALQGKWQELINGKTTEFDHAYSVINNGERIYFELRVVQFQNPVSGQTDYCGIVQDITSRHKLEEEQLRTIASLNEYVASERTLYQTLSDISVELDFDAAINKMIRLIGEFSGADRCYVFRYLNKEMWADNIYEWCREGVEPVIDYLHNVDMSEKTSWHQPLLEHRPIIITDTGNPPPGLEEDAEILLQTQGIKSLLAYGIWIDNELYGFIGFDHVRKQKEFSDCEIHTVNGIAQLYQLAFVRHRQRQEIEDGVSFQRQIVDNIPQAVTILDLDYTILYANPSTVANAGRPLEELLGTKCYQTACRFGEPPEYCPVRQTLQTGKPSQIEHDFLDKRLLASAQPIYDRNGKMKSILTVDIDITELTRQKKELQAAMEQAQAADRAKSFFLASVSHELRTPLNAIIGFSELLQQGVSSEEVLKDYLHSISFAGNALLNLVNDVLDFSKLASDQVNLIPVPTDVVQMIREVAAVFRLKAEEKNLELRVNTTGVRHKIFIDNLRLRQILFNLLGNATKFTDTGHIGIEAATAEDAGKAILTIKISDTGIGISEEGQKKIFEPFVQENHTQQGTGLGLAIIKRLLDKMNGTVSLESKLGVGSTFAVRIANLDIEDVTPEEKPPEENPVNTLPVAAGKEYRALLIDDVPLNLKVLRGLLARLGVASTLAVSVKEAMAILEHDNQFDVILTDMWMPEASGLDLALLLKKDPRFADMPIYVVTADIQVTDPEAFTGILHKPITLDVLRPLFQNLT